MNVLFLDSWGCGSSLDLSILAPLNYKARITRARKLLHHAPALLRRSIQNLALECPASIKSAVKQSSS